MTSDSSAAEPLAALCELYHIALEYHDIWGQRHTVERSTQRALLSAMGVAVDSEDALRSHLRALRAGKQQRLLPPVMVVWEDDAEIRVRLRLPVDEPPAQYQWQLDYEDGRRRAATVDPADLRVMEHVGPSGQEHRERTLVLDEVPPCGYHHLRLRALDTADDRSAAMSLIVAPRHCYQPQALREHARVWGPGVQLYAVRSGRNWGIGDFTDLLHIIEFAAQFGAGLVGVNPLHALFPHNPAHRSPYSPSSRLYQNILYIDVEIIADFAESSAASQHVANETFQARLRASRAADQVDYEGVGKLKIEVLEMLYRHFRRRHLAVDSERAKAFLAFCERQGPVLHRHAVYEALQACLHEQDAGLWGWPVWPEQYRDPDSDAVAEFARSHADAVNFFKYLQWQARLQLEAVGLRAETLGLEVGLYQDLALGVGVGGAETWGNQDLYAVTARIGSPPDDFNLHGQDWGLPPWRPDILRAQAYAPFIETLRQNMGVAGALRIDHVMALLRLFWIPAGQTPQQGAYVSYPLDELLGILALESQRNRCLVVGEDLGTVPVELREALAEFQVLAYRLLYFEKASDDGFKPCEDFDAEALVAVSTHDLPTLAGYWQGRDLEWRERLDLFPTAALRQQQVILRAEDRVRLLMALEREELLPQDMTVQAVSVLNMTEELAAAVHRYLARTPSKLMMVQMEDVFGQTEQINLPGTVEEHPNWCRKLDLELEFWSADSRVQALFDALQRERGRSEAPPQLTVALADLQQAEIPQSTYRWQFNKTFTLARGEALVPYLSELGISHCYASPCLQARPGSTHGYDVIDHQRINPELGGDAAFGSLAQALKRHQMGLLLDMAPNHMGIMGSDNAWWLDVLENGQASRYATFFDIDWSPLKDALRGKVLVPILGDHYGAVLDRGELELTFDTASGSFTMFYFSHRLPVDPREYPTILAHDSTRLQAMLGEDDGRLLKLQSLITAFAKLPACTTTDPSLVAERTRDKKVYKTSLARLCEDADVARFLAGNVAHFNSRTGVEKLHQLLESQPWRLAYWRVASDEINYRRFFDINELAGLRVENPEVFEATHERVLDLIASGQIQGLRIDHPDGLFDPGEYFAMLQRRVVEVQAAANHHPGSAQDAERTPDTNARPLYVLIEKILAMHERLHPDWSVHGTTGYDFANLVNGLFVDRTAQAAMDRFYRQFSGIDTKPDELVYESKKMIIRSALASELQVLAQQLSRIAERERHTRDFTLSSLRETLIEIVAWFPVYRTYITARGVSEDDQRHIDWAVKVAKKRSRAADITIFDFVRDVLLTVIAEGKSEAYRREVTAFAMKFQQYTGPVMAKGLEDTSFYRYNRLVSLNEVGGQPERFGVSIAAFHHHNRERAETRPYAMLNTSTHDSKRSEDVRARLNLLSECAEEWHARVRRWARLNRNKKRSIDGLDAPCRNDEYLLYQTLLGVWPLQPVDESVMAALRDRVKAYMRKAVKESKLHSSWINPDDEYEAAVMHFVDAVTEAPDSNAFLSDFLAFQQSLVRSGLCNSLAQVLLKLTAPGVPDFYQGNELWRFDLVDPDNRREVDYVRRRAMLTQLREDFEQARPRTGFIDELIHQLHDGRAKLYLIWRGLQLRRKYADVLLHGDYRTIAVGGRHAEHVCAFARGARGRLAVSLVPRLILGLARDRDPLGASIWADTWIELPDAYWFNGLTAERLQAERVDGCWRLAVGRILQHFPVALLFSGTQDE